MKLYHGTPKRVKRLKPIQAKGYTDFQNLKAVFLTNNFQEAALYTLGKGLKGITSFGVSNKLVILGHHKLKVGYVYEFDLDEKSLIIDKEKKDKNHYAIQREITPIKIHKVKPEDYERLIQMVNSKEELLKVLKQ